MKTLLALLALCVFVAAAHAEETQDTQGATPRIKAVCGAGHCRETRPQASILQSRNITTTYVKSSLANAKPIKDRASRVQAANPVQGSKSLTARLGPQNAESI